MNQDQDSQWDTVVVYFTDQSFTTIYVHVDDDIQAEAAKLADEEGLEVQNYKILVDD